MHTITRNILFLTLSTIVVASCSLQPPVPEDHFYRLPAVKLNNTGNLSNNLFVKRFVTDGLHSERPLLFSENSQPLSLKQYHYHFWVDAPPRLLQENLISALRSSGIAKTVSNYNPAKRDGHTLSGKIRRFEQVARGKENKVIIELELRLDDKQGNILFVNDYQQEQSAGSATPHDLVVAFGTGLTKIYSELLKDWQMIKTK